MFVVIWRYEARDAAAFARFYGAGGAWEKLFMQSPDFLDTEVLDGGDGVFVTIDRWTSAAAYDAFLAARRADYLAIDAQAEALTLRETLVGRFNSPLPLRGGG
jgi:hypothetical protein